MEHQRWLLPENTASQGSAVGWSAWPCPIGPQRGAADQTRSCPTPAPSRPARCNRRPGAGVYRSAFHRQREASGTPVDAGARYGSSPPGWCQSGRSTPGETPSATLPSRSRAQRSTLSAPFAGATSGSALEKKMVSKENKPDLAH